MVLLPNPEKYLANEARTARKSTTTFFENRDLDEMAKHFIGNNFRFYKFPKSVLAYIQLKLKLAASLF